MARRPLVCEKKVWRQQNHQRGAREWQEGPGGGGHQCHTLLGINLPSVTYGPGITHHPKVLGLSPKQVGNLQRREFFFFSCTTFLGFLAVALYVGPTKDMNKRKTNKFISMCITLIHMGTLRGEYLKGLVRT